MTDISDAVLDNKHNQMCSESRLSNSVGTLCFENIKNKYWMYIYIGNIWLLFILHASDKDVTKSQKCICSDHYISQYKDRCIHQHCQGTFCIGQGYLKGKLVSQYLTLGHP